MVYNGSLSRVNLLPQPGSNLGKSDLADRIRLEPICACAMSPQKETTQRRIPDGQILGTIPLEAAKAYPTRIFGNLQTTPRIAYADFNTHQEQNTLTVKFLPNGAKTAPHPQIVFFINGPYHVETLSYTRSNPLAWTTWMEFHLDAKHLKQIIDATIKAKIALEALKK